MEMEGIGEMQHDGVAPRRRGAIQQRNSVSVGRIGTWSTLRESTKRRHASKWEKNPCGWLEEGK